MEKQNYRHKKIALALCIGFIITFAFSVYADKTENSLADNLIRLHVIANSDEAFDQQLKLKVRDEVIAATKSLFADNSEKSSAEDEIIKNMDSIKAIAERVVADNGYNYPVTVTLGKSDFPTKIYGNLTLPAGTYNALKITIGSGNGQNWWCVLFPPLCFVNEATAEIPEESSEILKASMSDEEYAMVTGGGDLPVRVKFKSYELWQSSKLKLKNMIAEN